MRTILLLLIALVTCGCVNQIDYMVRNHPKKGDQHFYMLTAWGGQHVAESSAGTRYSGNLENSFAVAAQAVVTSVGTLAWKATELKRLANEAFLQGQITLRQKDALFFAAQNAQTDAQLQIALAQILNQP